jgi:hypothetical protein
MNGEHEALPVMSGAAGDSSPETGIARKKIKNNPVPATSR